MKIFVADSGKVLEAAGQDTEIENLEELLHLVGADNVAVTSVSIATSEKRSVI